MRIGCVKYLNARPLIHGWPGAVTLDHPAVLADKLARAELDVALVSSFEFLRNPIYNIVDNVSISATASVYSVVLAYTGEDPWAEVELDPASQTSVALLHCLFFRRGKTFRNAPARGDLLGPLEHDRNRLLIGDQAIRFRQKFGKCYRYLDLAEEWNRLTGLPFVFALWLVRPELAQAEAVAQQLRWLRDENVRKLDKIIAQEQEFPPDFCRRYYAEHLRFDFGELEKRGLLAFAQACAGLGLIGETKPDLHLV